MKNIFKSIAAAVLLLFPAAGGAVAYRSVVIQCADGTEVVVTGEKGMTLVFNDDEMRFTKPNSQYMAFPLTEVKGWRFSAAQGDTPWSGINDTDSDSMIKVTYSSDAVMLSGLPANSVVTLTALNGVKVYQSVASDVLAIDLSELTAGLYLLTYNNTTLKIALGR